ncbi:MAG: M20 family metallopeptidase [Variibacter sp.]
MSASSSGSFDLDRLLAGIQSWVEVESPTSDTVAVNRMIDRVQADAATLPVAVERIPGRDGRGDMLTLRTRGGGEKPGILILSHIDTVHPVGMLAGPLRFRRDGDKLYGPGIYDMKGGAYLAFSAFAAVARGNSAQLPVSFLFTPDEEVGSPTSRAMIEAEARRARVVLVTEPARDGGKVVTARKGVGRFELTTTGVPAHSGSRHQDGHSAIREMARQVLAIEAMTDYARGVTTTVGMINGGTAPNVIPQYCHITADLRVREVKTGEEFEAKILGLQPFDKHVKLTITGGMNRPPFEKTAEIDALLKRAQNVGRAFGLDVKDTEMTGGGSDGNFTAALGVPTLDGLGIDGEGAHTEWEHAFISSIVPRARLMQGLLETLG